MEDYNHYETLKVKINASQAEIKQAYRRLAKMFHPDSNQETGNHDKIIRINAAYEVLSDIHSRQKYDEQIKKHFQQSNIYRQERTASAQQQYKQKKQSTKNVDDQIEKWLILVYHPVNRSLCRILNSLEQQIDELAADPFDDELIDQFQAYLDKCREDFKKAQNTLRSLPNPPSLARAAAHLYYSLNQVGDGLDELGYFPLNYDDRYLHTGQEMFRIATRLHCEAQDAVM